MGSTGLSWFFFVFLNKMPAAVNGINRSGQLMLPAAAISFFAVGTDARHGEATINRDLSFVADTNARCGKRKVPVTANSCVVVLLMSLAEPGFYGWVFRAYKIF